MAFLLSGKGDDSAEKSMKDAFGAPPEEKKKKESQVVATRKNPKGPMTLAPVPRTKAIEKRKVDVNTIPKNYGKSVKEKIISGFLVKEGKIMKSWKKRFFILGANGFLYYYGEKHEDSPIKKPLDVKGCSYRRSYRRPVSWNMIKIEFSDRKLYVYARDEDNMLEWMKALESVGCKRQPDEN